MGLYCIRNKYLPIIQPDMCIISGPVESVAKTRIFAALVGPRTQLTVYSNQVQLAGDNSGMFNAGSQNWNLMGGYPIYSQPMTPQGPAPVWWKDKNSDSGTNEPIAMLLPVPLINMPVDSIKMIDMSRERDFFTSLESAIDTPVSYSKGFSYDSEERFGREDSLQVRRCGPYRYSVVPDVASFSRLKKGLFRMDANVVQFLQARYQRGYAFLACIIDKSAEFAPIGYIHPSDGKRLFLPTAHYHGHPGEEVATPDWDHCVYTIDRSPNTPLTDRRVLSANLTKAFKKPVLTGFPYKNLDWLRMKQRKISGYNPNGDILIAA